jgi:pSer/pThr/pTyr-binding forkhead associated (FHA) protein
MRDGLTRKLEIGERDGGFTRFLAGFRASLVVLEGGVAGAEHEIERPLTSIGRGPGVDLAFPDAAMSKQHASLEWAEDRLRLRDLGSMNGIFVNGSAVQVAELKHGDRFQLGGHVFQLVIEQRRREPRAYVLPDS